ncbi:TBC1 domain family member 5 homolog A-like [Colias croceus]|uniref:TBC1 domain family member 5 homolog A-like n=1 Tax=Colias crocea TaxID=72248 RepID=UPI001E280DB8|nr:TBC1 domain family member 5 homolog A-like [Colias croceus]
MIQFLIFAAIVTRCIAIDTELNAYGNSYSTEDVTDGLLLNYNRDITNKWNVDVDHISPPINIPYWANNNENNQNNINPSYIFNNYGFNDNSYLNGGSIQSDNNILPHSEIVPSLANYPGPLFFPKKNNIFHKEHRVNDALFNTQRNFYHDQIQPIKIINLPNNNNYPNLAEKTELSNGNMRSNNNAQRSGFQFKDVANIISNNNAKQSGIHFKDVVQEVLLKKKINANVEDDIDETNNNNQHPFKTGQELPVSNSYARFEDNIKSKPVSEDIDYRQYDNKRFKEPEDLSKQVYVPEVFYKPREEVKNSIKSKTQHSVSEDIDYRQHDNKRLKEPENLSEEVYEPTVVYKPREEVKNSIKSKAQHSVSKDIDYRQYDNKRLKEPENLSEVIYVPAVVHKPREEVEKNNYNGSPDSNRYKDSKTLGRVGPSTNKDRNLLSKNYDRNPSNYPQHERRTNNNYRNQQPRNNGYRQNLKGNVPEAEDNNYIAYLKRIIQVIFSNKKYVADFLKNVNPVKELFEPIYYELTNKGYEMNNDANIARPESSYNHNNKEPEIDIRSLNRPKYMRNAASIVDLRVQQHPVLGNDDDENIYNENIAYTVKSNNPQIQRFQRNIATIDNLAVPSDYTLEYGGHIEKNPGNLEYGINPPQESTKQDEEPNKPKLEYGSFYTVGTLMPVKRVPPPYVLPEYRRHNGSYNDEVQ